MTAVHEEKLAGIGTLTLLTLDPDAHAEAVHAWVTQPRAKYWGMGDHTVDQVREIYAFVDSLDTHHAYLMLLDDEPFGVFQSYEPAHDPVGELYQVEPGDVGMHLLVMPSGRPPRGLTDAVGPALIRFLFQENPARDRVVVEPDIRNGLALRRLEIEGFALADEIDLGHKKAQLAFLTRARFEQNHPHPA